MSDARRETTRDGFILVSVLAVVLVFVSVSAAMVARGRLFVLQERNRLDNARLQAVADGVARLAALGLVEDRLALPVTGLWGQCRRGDLSLRVSVTDQDMLLDLNGASTQMMTDVFSAIGLSDLDGRTLAAQIVDYRDPDDLSQPLYGAERFEYRRAGLGWEPRNGYFADVGEFAQLPAATPALVAQVAPYLTIYGGQAAIDSALLADAFGAAVEPRLGRWTLASRRQRFAVRVEARIAGRSAASRLAVVAVSSPADPPRFLKWSRYDASDGAAEVKAPENDMPAAEICGWMEAAGGDVAAARGG